MTCLYNTTHRGACVKHIYEKLGYENSFFNKYSIQMTYFGIARMVDPVAYFIGFEMQ